MEHNVTAEIHAAAKAALGRPFLWGFSDCYLFVADLLRKGTGIDIARRFRGRYVSPLTAMRLLKKFAGGHLEETVAKICAEEGWPEIESFQAQPGDIGVTKRPVASQALLIFDGHWWVGRSEGGVTYIQSECIGRAWGTRWEA